MNYSICLKSLLALVLLSLCLENFASAAPAAVAAPMAAAIAADIAADVLAKKIAKKIAEENGGKIGGGGSGGSGQRCNCMMVLNMPTMNGKPYLPGYSMLANPHGAAPSIVAPAATSHA